MILSYPSPCACCCLSFVFSSYGIGEAKNIIHTGALLCFARDTVHTLYSPARSVIFGPFRTISNRNVTGTVTEIVRMKGWGASNFSFFTGSDRWKKKKLPQEHGTTEVKIFEIFKNLPYSPSSVEQTENKRQLPPV